MLFKVWLEDLRKAVTADWGLWFVQLSTKGWGPHHAPLPRCPGTLLAFTLTLLLLLFCFIN